MVAKEIMDNSCPFYSVYENQLLIGHFKNSDQKLEGPNLINLLSQCYTFENNMGYAQGKKGLRHNNIR